LIAFDTNVLIYAEDPSDPGGRHGAAASILASLATLGAILPVQVLGEFVNVCRRKSVIPLDQAIAKVANYEIVFATSRTGPSDIISAASHAQRYNLQFFDALIATVARNAGATVLLSEDMHDGLEIDGLTVLNPFNPANRQEIDALLAAD
jgi:predicted nucleic acid-binding protein